MFRNLGSARRIGNFLSTFIRLDKNQFEGNRKSYLCIRVCMDVRKSLKKGTTLTKERVGHWVDFKYEKLPNFCFLCGVIGHSDKFCPLKYEEGIVLEKSFGVELRAGGGGGGGVKTSPTRAKRWFVDESSSSNGFGHQRKTDLGGEYSAETGASASHQGSKEGKEEVSGQTKCRRIWDGQSKGEATGEDMAHDRQKNGKAASQSS
ncbi:unnamed protein product [Cuscuta epithymum]|uniref:Zinc knuckle CX2CX4HX4C domain-containing protein n=1 Tax=Cuscuta epithymum TaxID=186058 RepID=A0AAV0F6N0_9ASTE|nr:unnamed protein product [Cuscuta epithymum]